VLVAGRLLRPLRDLRSATEIITSTDMSRRDEVRDGDDEVTHLALTFNSMLDRLEQSFAAQRRFLDDAGHELRTPITILRGHLEVLDTSDPADIDSTRALLLDEVDRMQRLVDDLMLLSRAPSTCPRARNRAPPNRAPPSRVLADRLGARSVPSPDRLVHGDLSADQVVWHDGDPFLIDFDRVGIGPAVLDTASLLATACLNTGAVELGADADPAVRAFAAHSVLRRAVEPFRTGDPHWPEAVASRIELGKELLR
jgi:HAMP domain-containing protein